MIDARVEVDQAMLNEVQAAMEGIKNGYTKVLVTSINKTLTTVKTQAAARVGNDLNLKAARIKEDFTAQKASYANPFGAFVSTGEPVGLMQYGAKQTQKGVSVKVKRSGSRVLLKHAFIATGRGSARCHVFWREGQDQQNPPEIHMQGKISKAAWQRFTFGDEYRKPLERLSGPRIEDILDDDDILTPIMIQANHLFLQNVGKQMDDVLRRYQNG